LKWVSCFLNFETIGFMPAVVFVRMTTFYKVYLS
jgi:hypothetical protein